jgi:CubicO group peptidase (beta-lactamase class C family)
VQYPAIAALAFGVLVQPALARGNDIPKEVDQIFAANSQPGSPGCSLGVIRDGRFVYRESYGAASLELGVPLSSHSVFYVGSISKQFTAASVVLAAEQSYLSLDDDVRKYIPELPDYGHTITLRQMLHQTSSFRDLFDLVYLSGHNPSDFNSPAEILKLVEQQRGLNNVPGDEWVYSNTNYFLLGIVVERATKKTLAEFASENIFRPLGMTHTRFYDDASVVVPDRVPAYDPGKNGDFLVDWSTTYAVVGGGGLMTTVGDLLLWDDNFYANRLGKGPLVEELQAPGVLNDGQRTNYGMGLFSANYRGLRTFEHGGALFGYRANFLRFPDQKFTVICLCNVSNADPEAKSRKVADLFLKEAMQSGPSPAPAADTHLPDPAAFAGRYLDPRKHMIYSFTAENGNLRGWGSVLKRKNANQYYDLVGDVITFEASGDSMHATLEINGEKCFSGQRLSEIHMDKSALQNFVGEYRSREVDGSIQVSVEQGNLIIRIGANPLLKPTPIANDEFDAEGNFLIAFHRDEHGSVSGLSVFAVQARGIEFTRTN